MRYGLIIAGGTGTRLWPLSRRDRPKQLLPIIRRPGEPRGRSLLEIAAARLEGLVSAERRFICTAEMHRAAVRAAVPGIADGQILGEPVGRDTVNAVGFGAAVLHKLDPGAVFIVLTADHLIEPEDRFRERADLAFRLVEQSPRRLVTFSIRPTHPATGYGYVERGGEIAGVEGAAGLAFHVRRFVEKPDAARAREYLETGRFAWNSGMFVFHAGTFMSCLESFRPDAHAGLSRIAGAWGTPRQHAVIDEVYPALPRISVDYAVMEPAASGKAINGGAPVEVCTVVADVQWLDVGSWASYAQTLLPGAANNRVAPGTEAVVADGKDNLVVADAEGRHTVALLGVEGLIVVHTPDATLVMSRDHAEQLKKLHEMVPESLR